MRPMLVAVTAAALLLAGGGAARAGARADLLGDAQKAYDEQRWVDAVDAYERLVAGGLHHEDVYYNLGNAYVQAYRQGAPEARAGKLGRAILAYERALAVDPGFDDARFNLQVARELVAARLGQDKVKDAVREPLWIRAVHWLRLSTLTWIFLGLDLVFFGVLIAVRFIPDGLTRTGLVAGNLFAGAAGLCVGVLLAGRIWFVENVRLSVVVADEVVMRHGPTDTSREMPRLHAGHRVIVLDEAEGWYRIRLVNKVEGYVPKQSVEEI